MAHFKLTTYTRLSNKNKPYLVSHCIQGILHNSDPTNHPHII